LLRGERLGEQVSKVVFGGNVRELDGIIEYLLTEEVVTHVDVLGSIMVDGISTELNSRVVVVEDRKWRRVAESKVFQEETKPDGLSSGVARSHILRFCSGECRSWLTA